MSLPKTRGRIGFVVRCSSALSHVGLVLRALQERQRHGPAPQNVGWVDHTTVRIDEMLNTSHKIADITIPIIWA